MNPASYDIIDGIPHYKLFIDGQWVSSSRNELADDYNPATGKIFARSQQAGATEVKAAIDAAERAFASWSRTMVAEREEMLLKVGEVIKARTPEIRDLLIEECGSVFGKALWEIEYVVDAIRAAAGDARHVMGETMPMTMPGQISISVRKPLGIVAGIAPFNSPFLLCMKKIVYALAVGNTFILKPSEETPLSGALIADLFQEAGLPAGVLNVVPGVPAEVGDLLMADPRIRMITFTGSTRTGRHLAVEAAKHLKRFTLEMGGKSPLIVLDDADVDYAVDAAAFGVFLHQGQVCMANSKVMVETSLFDTFKEKFVAKAKGLTVGDPRDPETVIGPLIRARQCEFIDGQIKDAVEKGAKVLTGGTYEGQFFQPTILDGVTPEMRIYHEESFGPVVSLIRVNDAEEALKVANDTSYGLSAALITNDMQKALDLSMRLESGMVHVNDCTISDEPHVPFGGVKNSGFGREGGRYSLEELTEVKWITLQMGQRAFPF
ncbi:putative aldehyde dehydrogenase YfmT [Hartmannibacter diazotrophicus]|uniref:Salicylaldehyde dehydrogenase n=1 Tax=Hartmannibacter diazotrophicus TaxID=1482074 RepID=A0A2C9D819_9HYPH|nr:aldehyde dehydrogenase family protein [Hartmannibacter diazotrophicus]SON55685.1 putative aldehyde dehydrogenase YfmT [Hartmannibacter diazotrophicus]